mgnify:CR=1 FL=1
MMYNIGIYRIYEGGELAESPSYHQYVIPAGEVGIADRRGLLCICKNDPELIRLSIFSHTEEEKL